MNLTGMHVSQTNRPAIRYAVGVVRSRDAVRGLSRARRSGTMPSVNDGTTRRTGRVTTIAGSIGAALGVLMVSAAGAAAQPAQLRLVQPVATTVNSTKVNAAAVPYAVGEELTYRATF